MTRLDLPPYRGREDDPDPRRGELRAAVALVLRGSEADRELLLVRRAASARDPWSGHMALPGGRADPSDASLLETAVRETREETAVDLAASATLLGRLDPVSPRGPELPPLSILPVVFSLTETVEARPRAGEIAEVLWVPVLRLRDPAARSLHHHRLAGGAVLAFPAIEVEGRTVWGLTHRILEDFFSRLG